MNERAPKHLDEDGLSLWHQCQWILAIRRQLRAESIIAEQREYLQAFYEILRHKNISPPMNPGIQESMEKEVARLLGIG